MQKKIAIFAGSECIESKKEYYHSLAYEAGKALALAGFTVITGAGTGLMDEATRGAKEAGGHTVGYGVSLFDPKQSEHMTEFEIFEKLSPRQEKLIGDSDAYVALPGGIGTLFEVINIIEYKKIGEIPASKPFILISDYFRMLEPVFATMRAEGFIQKPLDHTYTIADSPARMIEYLQASFSRQPTTPRALKI